MKCSKCGAEVKTGKFCEECGAPLEEASEQGSQSLTEADFAQADIEKIDKEADTEYPDERDADRALSNLQKYEEGTITHPDDKPKKKGKLWCPQNPMLWAFIWLTLFGLVLVGLILLFFNIDIGGTQVIFGISFGVLAAAVFCFSFIYYLPAALNLDRLLKGKDVRLEYKLKDFELVDLAEKAKKRNRGFYIAISLFGLAFSIYYIYILANATIQTTLMKVSLIFSLSVFVIFAVLLFLMPKLNYARMMENGKRVIIGNKAVYYGGNYYHWRCTNPKATFGNVSSNRHELEITFTQEFRQGRTKRRRVEMYAPDTALKGITKLLGEYEKDRKEYEAKLREISILNEKKAEEKKRKELEKEKKKNAAKEKQLEKEKKKLQKQERKTNDNK
ncbi:MAG: hypothetical protein NC203_01670 [Firmicutes bacterium]|nr:hypothetical protein [[Eubacterium] siraeum]MCM1487050.1 hypothetical protein [Bacillota bacterium]